MRKLGLNPARMLATPEDRSAMGGPLIELLPFARASFDPRFRRLGLSLARMDALQRGLQGIPQVIPAAGTSISSGFGYRSDPFAGSPAFHAGLDFKGPTGAPIFAAARGKIVFVGRRAGYGKCVEIDHGNCLRTRYAHMSAFRARGGGMIVTIGTNDTLASSGAQLDYYQSVIDTMGREAVDSFARLFVIPQGNHGLRATSTARDGNGQAQTPTPLPTTFDKVGMLTDWVERGVAPPLHATVTGGERSLPLCSYPAHPHYVSGPAEAAASYECRE